MSNQDGTQNIPALRLDGFEGVWIAQQLSEFLEKSTISNGDLAYGREDVYAVSLTEGLVNQIKFHGRSFAGKNLDNYDVVLHGDVVYTKSPLSDTPFGIVKCNSGEPGLVSPLYAVYHPKAGTSPHFVQHYFALHSRLNDHLRPLVSKGAKNTMNITDDQALAGEVIFPPTLEEQQAISAIFNNLDTTIRSHRKKLDLLKQTKTSLLQRMFPQDGQTEPDLRLDGFEGAWESAPLSQTTALLTDGDWIESKDQSTEGVRLLQTGNVGVGRFEPKPDNIRWISSETFDRLHCEEVLPGDILISRLPDPAGRACIVPKMPYRMITAVDCAIVRVTADHDPSFVVTYLSTPGYFNHINTLLAGGTRQRVSRSQLSAVQIALPPTLEEQQAIGAVFTKLNTLINAETQLIEKLKHTKTALLQKMFV